MATFTSTPHRPGPARFMLTDEDEILGTLHARDEVRRDFDGKIRRSDDIGRPDRDWLLQSWSPRVERPDEPVPW